MVIDWFTVIAQLLNFLVLVWLLKRFLYTPILDAIDAREKRIALAVMDAKDKKAEALEERDHLKQRNREFDKTKEALLSGAKKEAQAEGKRLRSEAREAANAYTTKRQESLQREQQSLHEEITRRTREEVFAIARKTLKDLAGEDLEERMTKLLIDHLRDLDDEKRRHLANAIATSASPVVVRSAFLLGPPLQKHIQEALRDTIAPDIDARFETVPELISGIELSGDGHKISWTINEYLKSLENSMSELMDQQAKPDVLETVVSFEERT